MKSTFEEKRLFQRFPSSLQGSYTIEARKKKSDLTCVNFSAEGMGLLSSVEAKPKEKVNIVVTTTKKLVLGVQGVVRWCTKTSIGWRVGVSLSKPMFLPLELFRK